MLVTHLNIRTTSRWELVVSNNIKNMEDIFIMCDKENEYIKVHNRAIIFDATCPLAFSHPHLIDEWKKGGATVIAPTILDLFNHSTKINAYEALRSIAYFYKIIKERENELLQVRNVEHFYQAKKEKKIGIVLAFQSTMPIEFNINLIDIYQKLGIKMILIAYNTKNVFGDGCGERTNCGLSKFGIKAIKEMNRVGITIDCSHTGYKTTMEIIEYSDKPVIFSHANSKVICNNPRNITDEQAIAVSKKGGVVGINGYPYFVDKNKSQPTIDDYINHIDHFVDVLGIDHVGIGIDYWWGQDGVASKEEQKKTYQDLIDSGAWQKESYPRAINKFPKGMELPSSLPNLTKGLLKRGYSEDMIDKIYGLNFMRVFRETW